MRSYIKDQKKIATVYTIENNEIQWKCKEKHTVKRIDPTIVASATTYSGKEVRMVQVVSDAALAE